MLDNDLLLGWADEAAEADDLLLAILLMHIATLRNLSDYRGLAIMKNYATLRARDVVSADVEEWPEIIER